LSKSICINYIVPVGKNNHHDHSNKEVLETLKNLRYIEQMKMVDNV